MHGGFFGLCGVFFGGGPAGGLVFLAGGNFCLGVAAGAAGFGLGGVKAPRGRLPTICAAYPCRTRLGGCTWVSGHKVYRTHDRPETPWWRSQAGDPWARSIQPWWAEEQRSTQGTTEEP